MLVSSKIDFWFVQESPVLLEVDHCISEEVLVDEDPTTLGDAPHHKHDDGHPVSNAWDVNFFLIRVNGLDSSFRNAFRVKHGEDPVSARIHAFEHGGANVVRRNVTDGGF